MSYVGNPLATAFAPRVKQDLTGQSGTSFTLSHAVSSANDLSVYINHVRQEPTTAYTVDYTTLTTTGSVASTDDFYIIFDELALQSIAHDEFTAMKATSGTFTGAITTTQLASSGPVSGTTGTFSGNLSVSPDTDALAEIGRAHIGYIGTSDSAGFSHVDRNTTTGYALRQSAGGTTHLNGVSGQSIRFNIAGSEIARINASGLSATLTTAAQPNVTSVGTLTSATVSGDLTVDSGTLKVDSSNNRVGIGTTSPAAQLHIDEGTSNSYGTLRLEGNNRGGDIEMYQGTVPVSTIRTDQSGNMYFKTSGAYGSSSLSNKLVLLTGGNLGIGTDNALVKLDVTGSNAVPATSGTSQTGSLRLSQSAGNGVMDMGFQTTNSVGWIQPTNKANLATNYHLVLNPNGGNVGVGPSTNPNTSIHVKQAAPALKLEETSTGGSKMIVIGVEADGDPYIDAPQSGGNIMFNLTTRNSVQFADGGVTNNPVEVRLRTGSGGINQCITGTNWGYSTGYEAFMLGRDDTASEGTFSFGYNPRINGNGGFSGNGSEVIFRRGMKFYTPNGANNGWYNQFNMTDGVTSGDFNDTSDEKLKENIKDINGGLSVIDKLRPVNFDWKDKGKGNGLGGFIAQEVQKILPNDVMGKEYIAPDREKDIEGTEGLSINSTSIIAHLVKAVQELEAKVKILENK